MSHFRKAVESANDPAAVEACTAILVELYSRTENSESAIKIAIDYFSESKQPTDIGMLVNLAKTKLDHDLIKDHFKSQNDLLGFALAGLKELQLD